MGKGRRIIHKMMNIFTVTLKIFTSKKSAYVDTYINFINSDISSTASSFILKLRLLLSLHFKAETSLLIPVSILYK